MEPILDFNSSLHTPVGRQHGVCEQFGLTKAWIVESTHTHTRRRVRAAAYSHDLSGQYLSYFMADKVANLQDFCIDLAPTC